MDQVDKGNPSVKRRRLNDSLNSETSASQTTNKDKGIDRSISPPLTRQNPLSTTISSPAWGFDNVPGVVQPASVSVVASSEQNRLANINPEKGELGKLSCHFKPSPVQLTKITDLAVHQNIDTLELGDILGDPLIKECWNFNYLFDLDFVMRHFDEDVRDMIKVKIIHGFWKRDDGNRIALLEQAGKYPNLELLSAYIPDPFGTHHTKMMILFRHDDTAQVIIHTANMIERDWRNMTQAVWMSPVLPLISHDEHTPPLPSQTSTEHHNLGTGERFKIDLIRYLTAYEKRLRNLTEQLKIYDFSTIRAAFIGSVPSRQKPRAATPSHTSYGWLGLEEILSSIPITSISSADSSSHIIVQISSIATLGPTPAWLSHLQKVLARCASEPLASSASTSSTSSSSGSISEQRKTAVLPKHNIIFPTPEEIRTSLDGYLSGGSIHWKLQSDQQKKQLAYMKPFLCHWKHDTLSPTQPTTSQPRQQAHRGPAAPHIKTYIRFSDTTHKTIDWAMVTSANLSKQAWGDVVNKKDEIWIQSWEAGVVVWPALFANASTTSTTTTTSTIMVPVFAKNMPDDSNNHNSNHTRAEILDADPIQPNSLTTTTTTNTTMFHTNETQDVKVVVGFRMPYDLPLRPYTANETPWCATRGYQEKDWKGRSWRGY